MEQYIARMKERKRQQRLASRRNACSFIDNEAQEDGIIHTDDSGGDDYDHICDDYADDDWQ